MSSLPTAKDTGLGETTTKEANTAVQQVLMEQSQCTGGPQTQSGTRKRKLYTSYFLHILVHFKPCDTLYLFLCVLMHIIFKPCTMIILDQKHK